VRFYFTGTEFLYDYNANLNKAVAAKRLPLTILCMPSSFSLSQHSILTLQDRVGCSDHNAVHSCRHLSCSGVTICQE